MGNSFGCNQYLLKLFRLQSTWNEQFALSRAYYRAHFPHLYEQHLQIFTKYFLELLEVALASACTRSVGQRKV
jgi:hypothetical protein